jgi:hypothetical protein
MPQSQISVDDRIEQILNLVKDISKPNFKQLARTLNIPYQHLLAYLKGRPTHSQRLSGTYKLFKAQDRALYNYIAHLDKLGIYIWLPIIVSYANYLLQRSYTGSNPPPSANS